MTSRIARLLAVLLAALVLSTPGSANAQSTTVAFETICHLQGGEMIYETPEGALPAGTELSETRPGCDYGPADASGLVDGDVDFDAGPYYGVCRAAGFTNWTVMVVYTDTYAITHFIIYCAL